MNIECNGSAAATLPRLYANPAAAQRPDTVAPRAANALVSTRREALKYRRLEEYAWLTLAASALMVLVLSL
jgi:hypothetical protein